MVSKSASSQQLIDCYSDQAEHFGQTREKTWPEFTYIMQAVELFQSDNLTSTGGLKECKVVDLGCGTGRIYSFLQANELLRISYTGVDIAPWMITQAKKNYPTAKRVVDDMLHYVQNLEQESVDIIIGVASVQHLMSPKQRKLFFSYAYRALRRWGVFLMTNWSYSSWFLGRYWRQQIVAGVRSLISSSRHRNDLTIPWKDPDYKKNRKLFRRHYHMFTLHELHQLARLAWFVITQSWYVLQDGSLVDTGWKRARNTWILLEKSLR